MGCFMVWENTVLVKINNKERTAVKFKTFWLLSGALIMLISYEELDIMH